MKWYKTQLLKAIAHVHTAITITEQLLLQLIWGDRYISPSSLAG
ncbi:MAG: hypothetical protein RMX68_007270 [Aulosira sp. ZfuVER01]|nr:hypothetical protein [Aulosira sp. ZfuVER01]MDZ8001722.1 hypothetical protein [Aulosira sp. DedVER01a]MDZ8056500.1 hypothetical protein [Aulosira sp. ZfuCHP01]